MKHLKYFEGKKESIPVLNPGLVPDNCEEELEEALDDIRKKYKK